MDYPDRRQVFIFGTASIDNKGQIVYLRDISDDKVVRKIFEDRFPDMPKVFLWAPVCRQGWLVEMECMALKIL